MVDRVVSLLEPAVAEPEAILVDATLGLGGHSEALLARFTGLQVVGIDRDEQALATAQQRLAAYSQRVTYVHAVFDEIATVLGRLGIDHVSGVLMDLGLSSLQIDQSSRGFAYSHDVPLDMRMDPSQELTAADVLNGYTVDELTRILRKYGEERFARRIAAAVVHERETAPFETSERLVGLIRRSVPAPAQRSGGHPAKRTFQALRIEVNGELDALERALPAAVDALTVNGRIVAMSYQSLEDRLVKRCLTSYTSDDVPPDFPVPGRGPELRLVTRGAERPAAAEVQRNPRAASARVRAAERIRVAA